MTNEEKAKKIEEVYDRAIEKIKKLEEERNKIISNYIKELEQKKIDAIRASVGL
jgi:mRNA-degrading endonuclease RelE of RelBE toxin-antitoxin system